MIKNPFKAPKRSDLVETERPKSDDRPEKGGAKEPRHRSGVHAGIEIGPRPPGPIG